MSATQPSTVGYLPLRGAETVTRRLEGKPVAEMALARSRKRLASGRALGWPAPVLASVHVGVKTAFSFYLRQQQKHAEELGIGFQSVPLPDRVDQDELVHKMGDLDRDSRVDAVLLQHPLPPPLDFLEAVSSLRPEKDVDGVGAWNLGRLAQHRPLHVPAVARAALEICSHYSIPLKGVPVTVLGRSETVGTPLSLLLLARSHGADATVTVAHRGTSDLSRALHHAEVIFSCAGTPGILLRETVPKTASVIDIGLSSVPDPSRPSGVRPAGDADLSLDGWVEALTPVPGGVGPVTVTELMENVVEAWERHHGGTA